MLAIALVHWMVWPDISSSNYRSEWPAKNYLPFFFLGYFIFGILIGGNSFPGFKSSGATIRYLTLPSSHFEKFLLQWGIRVLLFILLYPILFKFTVNYTADIYLNYQTAYLKSKGLSLDLLPKIGNFSFIEIFKGNNESNLVLIMISLMGLGGISLLFLGGTFFGKWNILKGPLAILLLVFVFFLHLVVLSHILVPEHTQGWAITFKIGGPEIIEGIPLPLPLFSGLIFLGLLSVVSWIAAYWRMKEKEV